MDFSPQNIGVLSNSNQGSMCMTERDMVKHNFDFFSPKMAAILHLGMFLVIGKLF